MTKIKDYTKQIKDELCCAKEYAEEYIAHKAKGESAWANKYKEMAQDELKHATNIHSRAVEEIEELKKIYTPTEEMQEAWDKAHKKFIEKAAWIKQMLLM